ncbi:MAG: type 1 glutamine amidotransferase [Chloroflexaceae bacterium]|jgi:protease I|nr:type 1 glutamine amidotransferase [Chloroflexaceae bacterium]
MAQKKLEGLRVAILAADGVEQIELTSPMEALQKAGASVEVVSLRPGKIQGMNAMVPGKKIPVDRVVGQADPAVYDALLLPGGHFNPDFLRQSDKAMAFVQAFDQAGKPIAVICHGPWVLASAGLVRDRSLTSWPGIKDDLVNAGAMWQDKALVRDGNWVSSRSPQDLKAFNKGMLALFAEHAPLPQTRPETEAAPVLRWVLGGLLVSAAAFLLRRFIPSQSSTMSGDPTRLPTQPSL